jgi:hypothetical protein
LLVAFDTHIGANGGALATKYRLTADQLTRVHQARLVWQWFLDALGVARRWAASLTETRDSMQTGEPGAPEPLPGLPTLPPVPQLDPGPPSVPAQLEPGFFPFFSDLVAGIKSAENYDPADGVLLGIEGGEIQPPDPQILPLLTGEMVGGKPELTCRKGDFQGYTVWLARPGQARRQIGFSTARRYVVEEPLPAPGTAEVWVFEVQYRYKDAPFGQVSQPFHLTVRG